MPHFFCEPCGMRLNSAALPERLLDPACPGCGAPFSHQHEVDGLEPARARPHVRPYDGGASLLARHRPIEVRPETGIGVP